MASRHQRDYSYNEYDVRRYEAQGRRPSYDDRGQVRGFRTRPGAPMHDPTDNIPISGRSLTPKSNWDSLFKPRGRDNYDIMKGTEPDRVIDPGFIKYPEKDIDPGIIKEYSPGEDPLMGGGFSGAPSRSLQSMSGGAPTHAEQWSTAVPLSGGFQTGNPLAVLNKYQTPGTTATTGSSFGWASAFNKKQDDDGTT